MPILYFAYGSNMLSQRLERRCASARIRTRATLFGYEIAFAKIGRDGSGKATLRASADRTSKVHGVVFELHANDILRLDAIEGRGQGYQRLEGIAVEQHPQRSRLHATTYIAEPHHIDAALHPFDWYRDLVLAGAVCASLPQSYCEWLAAHPVRTDSEMNRPTRAEALAILASIPESLSAPGSRRT